MLEPVMYEGGVHKHNQLVELVEDLGGYVIQKDVIASEVVILMLVPSEDMGMVKELASKLLGEITIAPLAGTEIATVGMTLAYHHYPHMTCDVAEYLRKKGAKTVMLGLSRGPGKRTPILTAFERELINEFDLAIFMMGNYEACLKEKGKSMYKDLEVPVIVTGASENLTTRDLPYATAYVGSYGRVLHQLRHAPELKNQERLVEVVGKILDKTREELAKDPLSVEPARVKKELEEQVPDVLDSLGPLPVSLSLRGVRVKVPFDEFHERIENVKFVEGYTLKELAEVCPSHMKNHILIRIKTQSETGIRI